MSDINKEQAEKWRKIMQRVAKKKERLAKKRKWCPGCSYPYYKRECPRCGGE